MSLTWECRRHDRGQIVIAKVKCSEQAIHSMSVTRPTLTSSWPHFHPASSLLLQPSSSKDESHWEYWFTTNYPFTNQYNIFFRCSSGRPKEYTLTKHLSFVPKFFSARKCYNATMYIWRPHFDSRKMFLPGSRTGGHFRAWPNSSFLDETKIFSSKLNR